MTNGTMNRFCVMSPRVTYDIHNEIREWLKMDSQKKSIVNSGKLLEAYWMPNSILRKYRFTEEQIRELRKFVGGEFVVHPIKIQCEILGINYFSITREEIYDRHPTLFLRKFEKVEDLMLEFYRLEGWGGERCEGASIQAFLRNLKRGHFSSNEKYVRTVEMKNGDIVNGHEYRVIFEKLAKREMDIATCSVDSLAKIFSTCYPIKESEEANKYLKSVYRGWQRDPFRGFCKDFPGRDIISLNDFSSNIMSMEKHIMLHLFLLYAQEMVSHGWPDLTINKKGKLKFIEVKSRRDKLNTYQAYWFRNVALHTEVDAAVCHVV